MIVIGARTFIALFFFFFFLLLLLFFSIGDSFLCTVLQDHLLAAQHLAAHQQAGARPHVPTNPNTSQHGLPASALSASGLPPSASPRDQHNIDPAIAAGTAVLGRTPDLAQPESPSDDGSKSYGKRPLSTSKRAAQNRAAQVCGYLVLTLSHTRFP